MFENPCLGLVELIEAGEYATNRTKNLLEQILTPMLRAGIDTLILGCTHYPFVTPLIQEIAGTQLTIINPAPAVARQTQRVLTNLNSYYIKEQGDIKAFTSENAGNFANQIQQLLHQTIPVTSLKWQNNQLVRYNPSPY